MLDILFTITYETQYQHNRTYYLAGSPIIARQAGQAYVVTALSSINSFGYT